MQPQRHSRRPQETHRCPDRYKRVKDRLEEMVRKQQHQPLPDIRRVSRLAHVERLGRYTEYKDHITLDDYEIHDGMSLEMY